MDEQIERQRRELAERALTATREELLSCKDTAEEAQRELEVLRRELVVLRDEAVRHGALAADIDKLKARSAETIRHLRAELSAAQERSERVDQRYIQLRKAYDLISERFELAASQLADLEVSCRRLAQETIDCRERTVVAERSLHEYLAGFADRNGSVAAIADRRSIVALVRNHFPALLAQLDAMAATHWERGAR